MPDRRFEQALLGLENVCLRVLESRYARHSDPDRLTWQHRFQNIATPVSLALAEYKGPRHFHYHYRHHPKDDAVLHPVLENPADLLAQVCKDALRQCRGELVGLQDDALIRLRTLLENALLTFLERYREYKKK